MEIKKVYLDRTMISSSEIDKRQNFNEVLILSKLNKQPTWKSPWFYGAVGLSSFVVASISLNDINKNTDYETKLHSIITKKDLPSTNTDTASDENYI